MRPAPSVTTLTGSSQPAGAGSPVTLSSTVVTSNLNLSGYPAGTVTFQDGNTTIPGGTVPLNASGRADFTTSFSVGSHNLSAIFASSNASQFPSAAYLTLTIGRAATATVLAATPLPAASLTATVTGTSALRALSGTVQFVDSADNSVLGTVALDGTGKAVLAMSAAKVMTILTHPIVAAYSGDDNDAPSTSAAAGIPVLANAAGGPSDTFAAGEFVSLFGYQLASGPAQAGPPLPVALGGGSIRITDAAGASASAGLSYASGRQINFVIPDGTASGPASIMLLHGSEAAIVMPIVIGAVAPGIFTTDGGGSGPAAAQVLRVLADGSQSVQDAGAGIRFGSEPVYLILYGTGIHNRTDVANVVCTIAGQALPVIYAGAQHDFPGLDQVDVLLPSSLGGAGTVDVALTVDGKSSNTAKLLFP